MGKRQRIDVAASDPRGSAQSSKPVVMGCEPPPGRATNGSTPAKPSYGIHANGFTSTKGDAENSKQSGTSHRPTNGSAADTPMNGSAASNQRPTNGSAADKPMNGSAASNHVNSRATAQAATNGNGADRSKHSGVPARGTENRAPDRNASNGSGMARPAAIYGSANGADKPRQDNKPMQGPAPHSSYDRERERRRVSAEMQQRPGTNGHRQVAGTSGGVAPGATPSKSSKCDKCDGSHPTDRCPHFKGGRENHKDAWANYGKEHPARLGSSGGNFVLRGAQVVRQPGDGSCLFHSLAFGLQKYGDRYVSAWSLRKELASFIQRNPKLEIAGDTLQEWVSWDANTTVPAYAAKMAHGRAWGGGIEIAAASLCKQANIHVYEQKGGEIRRISCFDYPGRKTNRFIHILYQGGMHYDALRVR